MTEGRKKEYDKSLIVEKEKKRRTQKRRTQKRRREKSEDEK
jgi:hypothetical protein